MIEAEAQLLVCIPDTAKGDAARAYAHYLHNLLGGQINYVPMAAKADTAYIKQAAQDCDLIILGESEQSCLEQMLSGHSCGKFSAQPPTSFLWGRRPCWPIQNILLILRFEETDDAAAAWLGRLAQPSGAAVTILPIVPSLPAMYSRGNRVQTGLDVLLSPDTPSGQSLRRLTQRMASWQISGELRLRQGEPERQIWEEVAEGDYDLIVIGAEPHGRLHRLLLGELVGPLLRWVERPLLIARSPQLIAEGADEQPIAS